MRTPGGEDDRVTKPHLFFERHNPISDLQFRITDLANPIDDPREGFAESPGGKRPACMVEVLDPHGGDGRRSGALRIRKGNLGEDQHPTLGLEDFGHPEAEDRVLPGQHDLLTVAEEGREDLPSRPRLREFYSGVPRPGTPGQNHEERQEDQKQGRGRLVLGRIYLRTPFSLKNFWAPGCRYLRESGVTCLTALSGVSLVASFHTADSSTSLEKMALTI